MKYILKNKDIEVLEFEVESQKITFREQISVQEDIVSAHIKNKDLMPLNFKQEQPISSLYKWIDSRKIPKNRENADKILNNANVNKDLMGYIKVSFGLSLNDSFWIVPADKDYKWKDYNLYDNKFDINLELVAFGITPSNQSGGISPEYTTNGMLKKCWHRENGQIYLYKGSSKLYEKPYEAYSEYFSSQIAKIMDFECVPYDLKEFHGHLVSSCPLFTNENEGFAPMYHCLSDETKRAQGLKLIIEISKFYKQNKFDDLMLFDALIYNIDRHMWNFGMIIDNNTNKLLRPAPIFDNGLSLIKTLSTSDLKDIDGALSNITSAFGLTFNEQLDLAVQPRHIPNLEKLTNFEFKRHEKFNLSDEWLLPIQAHIQDRAKFALQIAHKKQDKENNLIEQVNLKTATNALNFNANNTSALNAIKSEELGKQQAHTQTLSEGAEQVGEIAEKSDGKTHKPTGQRL